jgi:hypothetical protein
MPIRVIPLLVVVLAAVFAAHAGHEVPLYPSYYPQEIRIEAVEPRAAATLLETSKIHAYVGATPAFAGFPAKSLRFAESLDAFVVVRLTPPAPEARAPQAACRAAAAALGALAQDTTDKDFVFHPYPVTALHGDYLHHADLAEAAKERWRALADAPEAERAADASGWRIAVEKVALARLTAPHRFELLGWQGPPWLKQGWFEAYLLLAPALSDPTARENAEALATRLRTGTFANAAGRINAERELVGELAADCRTVVAGYALKKEYYSAEYSEGVENVAHDSHAGLNAPLFLRTVKLKDFPWNGWLRLGVPSPPAAAWNPIGGFDDEAGRLIWAAIADPAFIPEPHGAGWIANRIGNVGTGGAMRPEGKKGEAK